MCSPARASSTVRRRRSSTLLDEGHYARSRCIASWPPISRRERRNQSILQYTKPSLDRADAALPGLKLLGPTKWTYCPDLYVVLDIFSRYAVGWKLGRLIDRVLTLHSDRGAPMTSKCMPQVSATQA